MTDEELIARLRNAPADGLGTENLCLEGADRIEALVKERDGALEWLSASQGYIADAVFALDKQEEAEARAERLKEALDSIATELTGVVPEPDNIWMAIHTAVSVARTALKGNDHE